MISDLISGALKVGSSIFGGISASKAMKNVKNNLKDQQGQNEAWFNRRYNEDATQKADAQRIMTLLREDFKNRNNNLAATQAVAGGTEEAVASEKAANAQAMADAASRIAVAGEARKDRIEDTYQQRDAALNDALNNMEINKARNIATAVQGVGNAASGIAGAF